MFFSFMSWKQVVLGVEILRVLGALEVERKPFLNTGTSGDFSPGGTISSTHPGMRRRAARLHLICLRLRLGISHVEAEKIDDSFGTADHRHGSGAHG